MEEETFSNPQEWSTRLETTARWGKCSVCLGEGYETLHAHDTKESICATCRVMGREREEGYREEEDEMVTASAPDWTQSKGAKDPSGVQTK